MSFVTSSIKSQVPYTTCTSTTSPIGKCFSPVLFFADLQVTFTFISDIKDQNILVEQDYNIKLIDFGEATLIPKKGCNLKNLAGTREYFAPEIFLKKPIRGPEQDMWALGCVLFLMVFRDLPFEEPEDCASDNVQMPWEIDEGNSGELAKWPLLINGTNLLVCMYVDLADLIFGMLEPQINRRATIEQVLKHQWLS